MVAGVNVIQPPEGTPGLLRRIRIALSLFIAGLVISGVTAFPLQSELDLAAQWLGLERVAASGCTLATAAAWVLQIREALHVTYASYPFIAYGTDWLAFGHLIIALFSFRHGLIRSETWPQSGLDCGPVAWWYHSLSSVVRFEACLFSGG